MSPYGCGSAMAAATTTRTGRGHSPGPLEKDIIDTRINFDYCFGCSSCYLMPWLASQPPIAFISTCDMVFLAPDSMDGDACGLSFTKSATRGPNGMFKCSIQLSHHGLQRARSTERLRGLRMNLMWGKTTPIIVWEGGSQLAGDYFVRR